ncbi:MAG TPA: LysM peptidoglycan-binding domain-containing protein, partial [Flavobacterium sp.]|nr:LysM peptidoglycan-binding domain-containing protein [Flavobacterium sp.]
LYGISRKYEVSVADLEQANPKALTGLKAGDSLVIPRGKVKAEKPKAAVKAATKTTTFHTVVAGETKFGIAKQYGISVAELEAANPEIQNGGLQIGFQLRIVADHAVRPAEEAPKPVVVKEEPKKNDFQEYTVKPKETLYGLARRFDMSQDQLLKLNPELADGVKEGMVLKLPMNIRFSTADKTASGLAATLRTTERKKLVLLLPFNISKIQGDTLNSVSSRLKTDKFLNMTLDFYSGALMAIDSARTLGLNVDVRILDSQETKNASAVASLVQQENIASADAVIGPFYQANAEKAAELLAKAKVPVISPLSKDTGKPYPNLIQSMTQEDYMKDGTYNYMVSKGNVLAVVDPKKLSVKKYLAENQKQVRPVPFVNGVLSADGIRSMLVKDKKNFVVLETESTLMIKSTINALLPLIAEYDIQLAVTGPNETLDFEEIQVANLVKLRLLYPSLTRDNESADATVFEREYKEKNKIFPNRYAVRGFDVTFDTLLRLSQEKSYLQTLETVVSQQVANKFDYEQKSSGAFVNTGYFILYYDTDMTVKTVGE